MPIKKSGVSVPSLFHASRQKLSTGSIIEPGHWGSMVQNHGGQHPCFFREHLLEQWRNERTQVAVSRFTCSFAFEDVQDAYKFTTDDCPFVYSVELSDPAAPSFRADMLWLTWMGEKNSTTEQVVSRCAGYWAGVATNTVSPSANPTWEWLLACPLVITDRLAAM